MNILKYGTWKRSNDSYLVYVRGNELLGDTKVEVSTRSGKVDHVTIIETYCKAYEGYLYTFGYGHNLGLSDQAYRPSWSYRHTAVILKETSVEDLDIALGSI